MMSVYTWLVANLPTVLLVLLSLDRIAEKIWPSNATLKAIDQKLAAIGGKDEDGQ